MTEIENAFLPDGRQWAWNSVSLGLAKECPRKYYLSQILGWRVRGANVHLTFGGHYAKALERFHSARADGADFDQARRLTIQCLMLDTWEHPTNEETDDPLPGGQPWDSQHPSKNRETLVRSVIWYLEEFRDDPCKTVILADGRPAVELPFRFQLTDEIVLCGHLDRLVEYTGGIYVQDQKTSGSQLGTYYFNRYAPDNQMSLYSVAAKVVWATPVQGVMIDAAQIAVGFTRFARGFTHRTEDQCAEWLHDAEYHIKIAWAAKDAGYPMNDKACQLYGGCQFLDVCSKSPRVREDFLQGGFVKEVYEPLGVR